MNKRHVWGWIVLAGLIWAQPASLDGAPLMGAADGPVRAASGSAPAVLVSGMRSAERGKVSGSVVAWPQTASSTVAVQEDVTLQGLSTTVKVLAVLVLVLAIVVLCMLLDRVLKNGEHEEHPGYSSSSEEEE